MLPVVPVADSQLNPQADGTYTISTGTDNSVALNALPTGSLYYCDNAQSGKGAATANGGQTSVTTINVSGVTGTIVSGLFLNDVTHQGGVPAKTKVISSTPTTVTLSGPVTVSNNDSLTFTPGVFWYSAQWLLNSNLDLDLRNCPIVTTFKSTGNQAGAIDQGNFVLSGTYNNTSGKVTIELSDRNGNPVSAGFPTFPGGQNGGVTLSGLTGTGNFQALNAHYSSATFGTATATANGSQTSSTINISGLMGSISPGFFVIDATNFSGVPTTVTVMSSTSTSVTLSAPVTVVNGDSLQFGNTITMPGTSGLGAATITGGYMTSQGQNYGQGAHCTPLTNVSINNLNIQKPSFTGYPGRMMRVYINTFALTNFNVNANNGFLESHGSDWNIGPGTILGSNPQGGNPAVKTQGNTIQGVTSPEVSSPTLGQRLNPASAVPSATATANGAQVSTTTINISGLTGTIAPGFLLIDQTAPGGVPITASVVSSTPTTVTLSTAVTVANNDSLLFGTYTQADLWFHDLNGVTGDAFMQLAPEQVGTDCVTNLSVNNALIENCLCNSPTSEGLLVASSISHTLGTFSETISNVTIRNSTFVGGHTSGGFFNESNSLPFENITVGPNVTFDGINQTPNVNSNVFSNVVNVTSIPASDFMTYPAIIDGLTFNGVTIQNAANRSFSVGGSARGQGPGGTVLGTVKNFTFENGTITSPRLPSDVINMTTGNATGHANVSLAFIDNSGTVGAGGFINSTVGATPKFSSAAATANGSQASTTTINVSGVTGTIATGLFMNDVTTPGGVPANTVVISSTPTTVTLSVPVTVVNNDSLTFVVYQGASTSAVSTANTAITVGSSPNNTMGSFEVKNFNFTNNSITGIAPSATAGINLQDVDQSIVSGNIFSGGNNSIGLLLQATNVGGNPGTTNTTVTGNDFTGVSNTSGAVSCGTPSAGNVVPASPNTGNNPGFPAGCPISSNTWAQLPIGGGGFVTGVYTYSDGTQIARTDTAGAYARSGPLAGWSLVNTHQSMPNTSGTTNCFGPGTSCPADNSQGLMSGVCEIVAAPSNTKFMYMYFAPNLAQANDPSFVYLSTNQGGTWTRTNSGVNGFPSTNYCNANDFPHKFGYPTMGVSPNNVGIVYVGTRAYGVWYSLNQGATWTQIPLATVPASNDNWPNLIFFDPSDPMGHTVWITSNGTGVFKCTTAQTSPNCVLQTGTSGTMPTKATKMTIASTGTVWLVDDSNDPQGSLFRLQSGAWTKQINNDGSTGFNLSCVAVNPANTSAVYAMDYHGNMNYSVNAEGATPTWSGNVNFQETSSIIPWMQWSQDSALSIQNCTFDPTQTNVLYSGAGVGVFTNSPPVSGTATI
jgi:hypothetical protein